MDTDKLDPAVKAKLRGCETPEEILALAQEEGYELSDEDLEGIAGGMMWGDVCVGVACKVCRGYKGCKCY